MGKPIIEIRGLSKRYQLGTIGATSLKEEVSRLWARACVRRPAEPSPDGDARILWALRDVSLDVGRGEIIGVVGRNGAGKSTLLKILSRITQQTAGVITLRGRVASLLEVGTGFHPDLTGRENVFLNGAMLGMSKAEIRSKLDAIVAFAEVERFIDTPVKRYSSGMYVRLAFAVAAHLEPEILVVDEVLAVGDAQFQQKSLGRMGAVAREGRTVLFVSHNTAAIESLCSRAVLLEAGRLVADGPCHAVVSEYLLALSDRARAALAQGGGRFIRSLRIMDRTGAPRDAFRIGEDVVFEVALHGDELVDHPRFGIAIAGPRGERIATIHTDVQQKAGWAFRGPKRVRAVWRRLPLNAGRYRVDLSLWGYARELETLVGCGTLDVQAADVYGTGALPDPSYQGYLVPDAEWDMDADITTPACATG
jgi:lipopolysaccharide transport system ATP-binding protein